MSNTDFRWRVTGFLSMAAGYAVPLAGQYIFTREVQQVLAVVVGMPLALIGALLIVQGDRVARIWRVERSRHRDLVLAIRERRRLRRSRSRARP